MKYPQVVDAITGRLQALRDSSAPITVVTVRAIMVAIIQRMAPEIFEKKEKDGSCFRASDAFIRQWLHRALLWSERKATRAGHKLPTNWEDLCEHTFL